MIWAYRNLYVLVERLRCWSVLSNLRQLERMEYWTADRIEAWQLERLQRLAQHAYRNVPLYRSLWDKAGVDPRDIRCLGDLSGYPVVTKKHLIEAGGCALDQTMPRKSFIQSRSSGSTGEPLVYYENKDHYSWFVASGLHGWTWTGWRPGDPWMRLQFRGPLSWRARLEDRLFNCLYMPIDQLDDRFLRRFLQRAIRFDQVLVRGYAGATYVLAQFLLRNPQFRLRPKAVACTGDTLYPHYREAIEEAFQAPVFDSYGGEGMCVASQCRQGYYHILPPVLVEVEPEVSSKNREQPGRLILTSLTNYAMPLIRYDLADTGVLGTGTCPCGRSWRFLKQIVGRDTDIIVTALGRHLVCHHFNNILRKIETIRQFQVVQSDSTAVTLKLVTTAGYDQSASEARITEGLCRIGGDGLRVVFEYVPSIPVPPSGKRRYIISTVSGVCFQRETRKEGGPDDPRCGA